MRTDTMNEKAPVTTTENRDFTVSGDVGNIKTLGNKLGIRLAYISNLELGTFRNGDKFNLKINSDNTTTLTKIRKDNLQPGERAINQSFMLTEEAIYKNKEAGPDSFPYISFLRNATEDIYTLVDSKGNPSNITIATKFLDEFKKELGKISGKIITECSSRSQQVELACEIEMRKPFTNTFRVNNKAFWDIIGEDINMNSLAFFGKNDPKIILEFIIRSFHASQKK